jgi:hypothetical protein
MSVETTIRGLVCKTERTLENGLVSLGDFLVIDGVFDNIAFASKCREAEKHEVKHSVVRWIHATLSNEQNVYMRKICIHKVMLTSWP